MGQDFVSGRPGQGAEPAVTRDLPRPGKGTLVTAMTRHPCDDAAPSEQCDLDPGQRDDVRLEIVQRIAAAGAAYQVACSELRLEHLLDKESAPALFSLFLDVIGARVLASAAKALKGVRAAAKITAFADGLIDAGVKHAVDVAKKRGAALVVNRADKADDTTAYLSLLAAQGGRAFQDLSAGVLSHGTDQDLATFRDALDADQHTVVLYRDLLELQLARWRSSGVRDIGVKMVQRPGSVQTLAGPERDAKQWATVDRRVVRLRYITGEVRLGFALQDRDPTLITGDLGPRRGDRSVEEIPPEFHEAALAQHRKVWGSPPLTVDVPGMPDEVRP